MNLLMEMRQRDAERVPKGRVPLREFAVQEGVSPSAAQGTFRQIVQTAIEAGIVARKQYRVATSNGLRKVWHYWRLKPRKR